MATCYLKNGAASTALGPCNTTEGISLCCAAGEICLTNGLCSTGSGVIYQGGCTDRTYNASVCPKFCDANALYVVTCEGLAVRNGDFCCNTDYSATCCNEAGNGLGLAPSASFARVTIASSATTSNPAAAPSSSQLTLLFLSIFSSSSTASLATLLSLATSETPVITAASNRSTEAPAAQSEHQSWGYRHRIPIGVSLGVFVLLLAVKLVLWQLWVRQRKRLRRSGNAARPLHTRPTQLSEAEPHVQTQEQRSEQRVRSETTSVVDDNNTVTTSELHGESIELAELPSAARSHRSNRSHRPPTDTPTQVTIPHTGRPSIPPQPVEADTDTQVTIPNTDGPSIPPQPVEADTDTRVTIPNTDGPSTPPQPAEPEADTDTQATIPNTDGPSTPPQPLEADPDTQVTDGPSTSVMDRGRALVRTPAAWRAARKRRHLLNRGIPSELWDPMLENPARWVEFMGCGSSLAGVSEAESAEREAGEVGSESGGGGGGEEGEDGAEEEEDVVYEGKGKGRA